jgi:branched-chain amino acid transport system permease protein
VSVMQRAREMAPERRRKLLFRWGLIAFLILPLILPSNYANMGVRASIWTLALLSLVVLTGWVGQVSLAQAALMGIGAFSAAQVTNHLGLEFPFHVIVAALASGLVATGIGMAALRIKGLTLAIATLAFQWMLEASFLEWHPFSGGFNGIGIKPLKMGPYDFSNDRLFFPLAWAMAALVLLLVANLRDSKTGRAWFAIRGSEVAARSLGIDVTRYKLIGFACAGAIVGVAGALNLNYIGTATPLDYNFTKSITYLAVAVLGGIGAIGGALIGGIVFVLSDQLVFGSIEWLRGKIDIAAAALLMFTLIRNPGGLVTMREDIKERVAAARRKAEHKRARSATPAPVAGGAPRAGEATMERPKSERASARRDPTGRSETEPVLQVESVTVRFGGLTAVDSVSLEVREGEICALIGPNGAGKTTLFNVINGFQRPNGGHVRFKGEEITDVAVHDRADRGMARTFQIMRLLRRMTVMENLMVATHRGNRSGLLSNLLMLNSSKRADDAGAERALEALRFLEIEHVADRPIESLPFGVLRLVELARALVTVPDVLLLDEPASGLDVQETETFGHHLQRIRDELGKTILLIEHDMSLVMDVSDHIYVVEFGRNLADGSPDAIQEDDRVIAAYLGELTDA